jgi:NADH-quinone oxidoreductase subunit J
MNLVFFVAASVALITTALAITRVSPVYGLLNFILSLLAIGVIFFTLGAPFAAALEVMVYAGAIMVLFLFVVMMLNLNPASVARERSWLSRAVWIFPALSALLLAGELAAAVLQHGGGFVFMPVSAQAVGQRMFTTDIAAVELASMLLLAALIGAYHLGRPEKRTR